MSVVFARLWWKFRQLICFHGPVDHVLNVIVTDEGEYAKDICRRCGKIIMKYVAV